MTPTRNNRGIAHENGSVESRDGHLKGRIGQELLLRGSSDFATIADYRRFVAEQISRHNARRRQELAIEMPHLKSLPERKTTDYDQAVVVVTSSGGFTLRKIFYTAPSTYIGHRLQARLYDERVECYLGGSHAFTLPRGRAPANGKGGHGHVVDYRHVIYSLRRKPQALANLVYRDQLFPRVAYARTWQAISTVLDQRTVSLSRRAFHSHSAAITSAEQLYRRWFGYRAHAYQVKRRDSACGAKPDPAQCRAGEAFGKRFRNGIAERLPRNHRGSTELTVTRLLIQT